jgi:cation transport regulator ChaC
MLYFAYGMNTNNTQMSPTATRLGPAKLNEFAWEMLLYANVYESVGSSCIGILWDIDQDVLAGLDIREGYPTFYTRLLVDVEHQGTTKPAWVYTMTHENREYLKDKKPSEHYYNSVVEGYATDGLDLLALTT